MPTPKSQVKPCGEYSTSTGTARRICSLCLRCGILRVDRMCFGPGPLTGSGPKCHFTRLVRPTVLSARLAVVSPTPIKIRAKGDPPGEASPEIRTPEGFGCSECDHKEAEDDHCDSEAGPERPGRTCSRTAESHYP